MRTNKLKMLNRRVIIGWIRELTLRKSLIALNGIRINGIHTNVISVSTMCAQKDPCSPFDI